MSGFNLAGAGSGLMQGASAGMSIGGPWGAAAGALLGAGLGGFGGGGTVDPLEYGLTPREEELQKYAFDQTKASPGQKRKIVNKAKSYLKNKGAGRGAFESYLEGLEGRYTNPEFIDKRLARSYDKPINYYRKNYRSTAKGLFGTQGIGFTPEEYDSFVDQAKAQKVRSAAAFGDLLKSNMIASGKVMSPNQQMLADIFGAPERDASGRLTGRYGDISNSILSKAVAKYV
jgi:hypothetical protein